MTQPVSPEDALKAATERLLAFVNSAERPYQSLTMSPDLLNDLGRVVHTCTDPPMTALDDEVVLRADIIRIVAETTHPGDDYDIEEALLNGFSWLTEEDTNAMFGAVADALLTRLKDRGK